MKSVITEQEKQNLKAKFKIIDYKEPGWLGYLKLDPTLFAYKFFTNVRNEPFKVFPHQDIIMNDKSQLRLLNIARGTGKSTIAAVEAVHSAYFNDNTLVLIMSATKPQALEVILKIKTFLNTSRFTTWKELMPKGKENKAEVYIKNKGTNSYSRIISVPATDAGRGYSPSLIICDELAFWENADEIFNQVVLGMLNRIDGITRRVLALSTPNGRHGPFWDCFNSKEWSSYSFDWKVNPYNTQKMMDILRSTMTDLQFRAEYGAEFVSSRDSYFTINEIKKSVSEFANEGWKGEENCYVGVDFGKIHDKCVIDIATVVNPDDPINKHVVRIIDRRVKPLGSDYALIISELKAINNVIHPVKFILDATGVGEGPSDVLRSEGLPIEAFKFSLFSKVTIMNNLKILMQQGRVQIPDEKELLSQLEMFEYEASEKGGTAQPKLHAPEGCHDDEVDALALVCYGITKGSGFLKTSLVGAKKQDNPNSDDSDAKYEEFVRQSAQRQAAFQNWVGMNHLPV